MPNNGDKDTRHMRPKWLRGVTLTRKTYNPPRPDWDHDHCATCGSVKFADFEGPDIQHEGYTTTSDYKHGADYHWVCVQCFADLKDQMGWTESNA